VTAILLTEDPVDVVDPGFGVGGVAQLDAGRPVQVEAGHALALDPAAVDHEPVLDEHRLAWAPRHPLDALVLVEPSRRPQGDDLAVLVALRPAGLGQHRNRRQAGVDARTHPDVPARREDVHMGRRIGDEVLDVDTAAFGIRLDDLLGEVGVKLAHVAGSPTRSLKSAPARCGLRRTTVRPARIHRLMQVSDAISPASSWSTRMMRRSTPGMTGNALSF
jgi:hypothetical protein